MSKHIKYSKTFWVNVSVVIVAGLTGMMNTEVIANNPQILAYLTATMGAVNIILRFMTSSGVYVGKTE